MAAWAPSMSPSVREPTRRLSMAHFLDGVYPEKNYYGDVLGDGSGLIARRDQHRTGTAGLWRGIEPSVTKTALRA
jgi:hypothetical protein